MLRWIAPVGAGLILVAGTGAYALSADQPTPASAGTAGCAIMFADGNPYWSEFSKTQLVEADKEVRRLPGFESGWLIVLHVDSQRDRLLADYDSTERKARRAKNQSYYQSLPTVPDTRQAVEDCVINIGEP